MKWPPAKGIQDGDYKLDRTGRALKKLGNPQMQNVIHVAGTNGKGSTIAFLRSILENSGYSVNVYTSPHFVKVNERIRLGGHDISDDNLDVLLSEVEEKLGNDAGGLTFFEGMTVAAFYAFAKWPADFNIIEVGLGGRYDATNVIESPLLSVITSISLDHMEYLGNTVEKIASEKAEIIKHNSNAVIGFQKSESVYNVFSKKCDDVNTNGYIYGRDFVVENHNEYAKLSFGDYHIDFTPSLRGDHQFMNAATAISAAHIIQNKLNIELKGIQAGISSAVWNGRIEKVSFFNGRDVYIDSAHNQDGIASLMEYIKKKHNDVCIIAGFLQRKDVSSIAEIFNKALDEKTISSLYVIPFDAHEPCADPKEIQKMIPRSVVCSDIESAIRSANGTIFICGSMYMIGGIMAKFSQE